ncbi:uncharacterized protein G2W53_014196 [Senna tora]|uniref:Uncharacterized protein n=1 Tax=Senna tora TaxID=362788 RepID=A0A834WSZ2_9FABA|nr:uncharacterized protein G2W53_014196 [Senna tora]
MALELYLASFGREHVRPPLESLVSLTLIVLDPKVKANYIAQAPYRCQELPPRDLRRKHS